jgi:hypothetical protein
MTRRHYGIRVPKPRPTYTGPARAGAWSGSAFISVIVVILIVLGVILYGLSKTITDSANTTTSVNAPAGVPFNTQAFGINERGQIAGEFFRTGNNSNNVGAYVYSNGTFTK